MRPLAQTKNREKKIKKTAKKKKEQKTGQKTVWLNCLSASSFRSFLLFLLLLTHHRLLHAIKCCRF